MAEPNNENVRIAVPPRPEENTVASNVTKHDTARIVLPPRTPVAPIRRSPPNLTSMPLAEATAETSSFLPRRPPSLTSSLSHLLQPMPKPPGVERDIEPAVPPVIAPENPIAPTVNRGPNKETARISPLPRPTPAGTPPVNLTKTQPLPVHPAVPVQPVPAVITSRPITPVDAIPRSLCWALLAISTVIFLIQIWNYVVS